MIQCCSKRVVLLLAFVACVATIWLLYSRDSADSGTAYSFRAVDFIPVDQAEGDWPKQTAAELDSMVEHAAGCERSVIFVHANWSLTSKFCLLFYDDYIWAYLEQPGRPFVNFHAMDYSVYNRLPDSLAGLEGWDELSQRQGRARFAGDGELIYLENGKVVASKSVLAESIMSQPPSGQKRIQFAVDWTNKLVDGLSLE